MSRGASKVEQLRAQRDMIFRENKQFLGSHADIRLSFWAFTQYQTCPQKYIMNAVGRRIERPRRDHFNALTGSVVHSLMEDHIGAVKQGDHTWDNMDWIQDRVVPYYDKFVAENWVNWHEAKVEPDDYRRDIIPILRKSAANPINMMYQEGLLPHDPDKVHMEYSFKTPLANGAITLTGRTDLVFEHDASLDVVDFKDIAKRSNVDWRQLVWYAFGIEPQFKKPVTRSGFLLTKLGEWSWRKPGARHPGANGKTSRDVLWEQILETVVNIRRAQFEAKVSRFHCHWCDVKDLCPEWFEYAGATESILAQVSNVLDDVIKF